MTKSPQRFAVLALVLGLAGCIIIPDPTTKKVTREFVCGVRPETGEKTVGREMFRPYLYSITPIGLNSLDGNRWIEYSLVSNQGTRRLRFLDEEGRRDHTKDPDLMHEFLPIRGTSKWAAFKIARMTREQIDLQMIVFDPDGICAELRIEKVVRQLKLGYYALAAYSVSVDSSSGLITVVTQDGKRVYDVASNRFRPAESS